MKQDTSQDGPTNQSMGPSNDPYSNLSEPSVDEITVKNDDCSFDMDGIKYGINLTDFSLNNPRDYIFQKSPLGQQKKVLPVIQSVMTSASQEIQTSVIYIDKEVQVNDSDKVVNIPLTNVITFDILRPIKQRSSTTNTKKLIEQKNEVHTPQPTVSHQLKSQKSSNVMFNKSITGTNKEQSFKRIMTFADPDHKRKLSNTAFEELNVVNSEKRRLEEQLQQTKQQLKSLNHLFIDHENVADSNLHLAFLYASPLVMRCQGGNNNKDNFKPMPQLEFKREFKEIQNSIKETKRHLKVKSIQATVENLTYMLAQKPLALHFSGHGIENTPQFFGRDYHLKKNEGNFLLFESEDGEGELVSEKKLQEFIKQSNVNLEFVFVASCNSEPVGRIFLNAGAKHVICVKNGQEITDEAVITFSKSFYHSVFSQQITICAAYNIAQAQVEVKFGKGESNKFSLLKQEGNKPKPAAMPSRPGMPMLDPEFFLDLDDELGLDPIVVEEHKCKVFGPLKEGKLEYLDFQPRFKEYPARVEHFVGRQVELQDIVRNTFQHRLVNIIGLPGIGKTALSKNVAHYIAERKIFKTGIIFMSLKGFVNCELFLKKLLVSFVSENFELEQEEKDLVKQGNTEALLKISLSFLKNLDENILLIFDNVEDLLYYDKLAFRNLINDLLVTCPLLHILMTSRSTLGTLQDIQEKIIVLQELNQLYTVKLFMARSREIQDDEIKEFLKCQSKKTMGKQLKPLSTMGEHHLFKLLGGNPHAITLAAPLLLKMNLKDLYLMISSKEMHEVLKVDGITDSTVASLRLSLEASIKILEREDKKCLSFFFLIGMLPGGVYEEDLTEIWGSSCQQYIHQLINLSLIQKKEQEKDKKTKYILPPFMSNYAEAKIPDQERIKFQNDICKYYSKVCKQILETNNKVQKGTKTTTTEQNRDVMERLLHHETNIWASIYRLVDKPALKAKQSEDTKAECQDLNSDVENRMRRFSTLIDKKPKGLIKQNTLMAALFGMGESFKMQKSMGDSLLPSSSTKSTDNLQIDVEPKIEIKNATNVLQLLAKNLSNRRKTIAIDQSMPTITSEGVMQLLKSEIVNRIPTTRHSVKDDITVSSQIKDQKFEDSFSEDSDSDFTGSEEQDEVQSELNEGQNSKQTQLQNIMRNSVVNFQKPIHSPVLLTSFKAQDTSVQTSSFNRSSTYVSSKTAHVQKADELHYIEKLILYYATNLFLLQENDNALNLIEEYGLQIKGCQLYIANLQRVQALIYSNKGDYAKSIEIMKKAKDQFQQIKSEYGEGQCQFGIGYFMLQQLKGQESLTDEVQIKEIKQNLENSLHNFTEVSHLVGQLQSQELLIQLFTKLNNQTLLKQYKDSHDKLEKQLKDHPRKGPYVERTQGPELSILCEIILQSHQKDLFLELRSSITKKPTRVTQSQPRYGSKYTSTPNFKVNPSLPLIQIDLTPAKDDHSDQASIPKTAKDRPPTTLLISNLAIVDESTEIKVTRSLGGSKQNSSRKLKKSFVKDSKDVLDNHLTTSTTSSKPDSTRRRAALRGPISDTVQRLSQTLVGYKKQITISTKK